MCPYPSVLEIGVSLCPVLSCPCPCPCFLDHIYWWEHNCLENFPLFLKMLSTTIPPPLMPKLHIRMLYRLTVHGSLLDHNSIAAFHRRSTNPDPTLSSHDSAVFFIRTMVIWKFSCKLVISAVVIWKQPRRPFQEWTCWKLVWRSKKISLVLYQPHQIHTMEQHTH